MAEPAFVMRAAGFLALLVGVGWMVAQIGRRKVDLFAALWWGIAVVSVAGVMLGRSGRFSLTALGVVLAAVGASAAVIAALRGMGSSSPRVDGSPWVSRTAWIAAAVTFAWCWPPFETFIGASDSTMYVDAGIHLARTGAYEVTDTVTPLVPETAGRALFASVGVFDQGPYIRLPGGLLMSARTSATATPAFFPLLSTWTGLLAALGGPSWAPAIAPLGTALAVAAVTLFAGEAFGVAVAVPTALIFAGNFAVWWFGRFAMSEPLTIAFLWGGLVFLGRGAPLSAGVMLGLAGLARAETLLFAVGAVACWGAWMPVRGRDLLALAVGAVSVTTIAAAGLLAAPNHHVAYLTNDLQMARARASEYLMPAIWDGRVLTVFALLPLLPMSVATAAAWGRAPIVRTTARALVMFAVVVATMVYIRIGGKAEPVRHLGWLATSLSPLGLLLAIAGTGLVWIRGTPTARLAVILLVLIALVFVPSPRVATFQPWAMRRYLTVVLPMLALGAGVVIGTLVSSRRRVVQAIAAVALTAVVVVQVRPTLAARSSGYFAGSLAGVRALVDPIPADAIVVVDSSFADFQLQVAIWLVYGRETVMATSDGFAWRLLLPALVASGRPVYWVQNAWMQAPGVNGLTFEPVALNQDLTLAFPDSPADTPPAVVVRKAVRLNIYGVGSAVGRTQALPTGSSG